MLTPARRVAISIGAAAAIAAGGGILFWIGGFLSYFVVEWFRSQYGTGGIGAVSVGVSESVVLLLAALPVCIFLNRRLRTWARSTSSPSLRIHRLHSLALWGFFVLIALGVALIPVAGGDNIVFAAAFGIILTALGAYGCQFLLLGVLLGMYAAAPDPKPAQP